MAKSRTSPPEDAVKGNGWVPPPLPQAPTLPPPRRRRRPALLALAVAMVVLGALGAAYLASSLGQTSSVIAVARQVPWGETITAADLAEARVSADPALTPIPYADRDQVIGRTAAADLQPGTLLTRDAVTDQRFPPPGQQLVGIGVSAVQAPVTPLRPGDDVLLVPLTRDGIPAPPATAASTVAATVLRAGAPGTDGLRVVDVLVDAADGPDVAARAAAGLIAIVVVAGE
jgi:SAF domain